jgi:hypothetical protein
MGLPDVDWLLEHSEVTAASPAFIWKYMTDVTNWNDPPARFSLEGPFEAGSRGMTLLPDGEPYRWTIEQVQPGRSYTIGSELDQSRVLFQWRFDPRPEGGTRISQRIGVAGPAAARHAEAVRSGFEPTLAGGMKRIALMVSEAEARQAQPEPEEA